MKKAPFVSALKASGFLPFLWESNTTEFVKTVEGCEVYVKMPVPRKSGGVISVTRKADGSRLLTTYFSCGESFFLEMGTALHTAYAG